MGHHQNEKLTKKLSEFAFDFSYDDLDEINLTGGQSAKFMTVDENGYAVVEKDNKKIFVSPVELFNEIKELKLR